MRSRMPRVLETRRMMNHHLWERREAFQRAIPLIGIVAIEMATSQAFWAKS